MADDPNPVDEVLSELGHSDSGDLTRVDIYLDDVAEPLVSYRPPVHFEIDTTRLDDGPHKMRVEAFDRAGTKGVRTVNFTVRNGPGIAIHGVHDNDQLAGTVPVLVNAYGGVGETHWEPSRAETPSGIPTWAWVMVIAIAAFGIFYGVRQWQPPEQYASTPTYGGTQSVVSTARPAAPATAPPQAAGADVAAGASAAAAEGGATAALSAADIERGNNLYASNCASCHQANGSGMAGVFPPLAGDHLVVAEDPTGHIEAVLHGLQGVTIDGVTYASPMPSFAFLSDEDIAAIVNHERTSWGNSAPTVTAADVAALR